MSVLALSELSESQIDAMRSELMKRLQLFRITSVLNQLPATNAHPLERGVTPGVAVAGNLSLESHA